MPLSTVTVTGAWLTAANTPATGRVTIAPVTAAAGGGFIVAGVAKTEQLAAGSISTVVVSNAQATTLQYKITEMIDGVVNPVPYYITPSGTTLDLSTAPRGTGTAVPMYVLLDATGKVSSGLLPFGTAAGTVAAGNDARLTGNVRAFNVRDYGALGDNTADDSTSIVNAVAAAKAFSTAMRVRVGVFFPPGKYRTTRFTVPGGVSLAGAGLNASYLINISTDGFVFINFTGSRSVCSGLTIDGQRALQPTTGSSPPTPAGLAAVQFSRPNNPTAGALNISGGVILTTPTTAGGTSIAINNATPGGEDILPGDIITLVEGANYEMIRVAQTYTPGTLTIPVVGSTGIVFSTAAQVSVASNDVGISDCRVFSNGRDGIAFWHVIYGYADRNMVFDSSDTSIDMPSAGSRFVRVRGNAIETNGQWGVAFDTGPGETAFGRVADCSSEGNTIRFVLGGVAPPGGPTDGIYFGAVDRCRSVGDTIDLSRAGLSGVAYKGPSTHCHTNDVTVIGNATPRAGTSGIRQTIWTTDLKLRVRGGQISGVANGIDLGQTRRAHISDTDISNVTSYAITVLGDSVNTQMVTIVGVEADTNTVGIRFAGTPTTGNKVSSTGCSLSGWTFAATDTSAGWTHVQTGNNAVL
jgi:hypothetical protein